MGSTRLAATDCPCGHQISDPCARACSRHRVFNPTGFPPLTQLPTNLAGTEGFLFGSKEALADGIGCEIHVGAGKNASEPCSALAQIATRARPRFHRCDYVGMHVEMLTKRFPNLSREEAWILVSRYFNKKT
jgi:hypothetical protein